MGESEGTREAARAAIEEARRTVFGASLLDPEFRETAYRALDDILQRLDAEKMPVQTAIDVTGRLMDMVVVQMGHRRASRAERLPLGVAARWPKARLKPHAI